MKNMTCFKLTKLISAMMVVLMLGSCGECPVCQHGGFFGFGCENDSNYNVCMCWVGQSSPQNCAWLLGTNSTPAPSEGVCGVPDLSEACATTCSCTVPGQTCVCSSQYLISSCGQAIRTSSCH